VEVFLSSSQFTSLYSSFTRARFEQKDKHEKLQRERGTETETTNFSKLIIHYLIIFPSLSLSRPDDINLAHTQTLAHSVVCLNEKK
jgi:hypothetical protein